MCTKNKTVKQFEEIYCTMSPKRPLPDCFTLSLTCIINALMLHDALLHLFPRAGAESPRLRRAGHLAEEERHEHSHVHGRAAPGGQAGDQSTVRLQQGRQPGGHELWQEPDDHRLTRASGRRTAHAHVIIVTTSVLVLIF